MTSNKKCCVNLSVISDQLRRHNLSSSYKKIDLNEQHVCCEDDTRYDSFLSVKMTGTGRPGGCQGGPGGFQEGPGGCHGREGGEEKMHVSSDSDYFSFTAQANT